MRPREFSILLLLALIWGASFLFIRVAVLEISPFALVFFRLGLAALVLLPVVLIRPRWVQGWQRYIPGFLAVGLVNAAIPYTLFGIGETHVASGQASIINATTPLFAVIMTASLPGIVHERLTVARGIGALVSFGGVLALVGPSAFAGSGDLVNYLAILAAAFAYAVGGVLARVMLKGAPLLAQALGINLAGFLFIAPVAIITGLPQHLPSPQAIASIATLSILGTAVAFLLFYWLFQQVGVTRTVIVTYLLPCTALVWGAVLLHETLTLNVIAGLVLVLLGIAIINNVFGGMFRRPVPATAHVPTTVE
jgi:drug/metabolite transporter (DMT)-like permease